MNIDTNVSSRGEWERSSARNASTSAAAIFPLRAAGARPPLPRTILFVMNCLSVGGAEMQVLRLVEGLRARGWRADVVSMLPGGPMKKPLRQAGARVYTLGMRPGVPSLAAIAKLAAIVRRRTPTVVHSHILHANLLSRVTRLVSVRMPVLVCTAHNIWEGIWPFEIGYRLTDAMADLTTNVSQAAVDRYRRIGAAPAGKIRFIPNGLEIAHFAGDASQRQLLREQLRLGGRFTWLGIGRFEVQKDYPTLLRAFATIVKEEPVKPALLLVGVGSLLPTVRKLSEELQLGEHVQFLGARSDVPGLMSACDGYVLSSRWEGMPLVLQEAAASRLPIVATRVGGNAEVVLDGRSGLLVPPGDCGALARAMRRVMSLPGTARQEMGRIGHEHVADRYGMRQVLDRWESIYAELLGNKGLTLEAAQ